MADANSDLVALADVRTYLKITSGEETILAMLITQVSERFAREVCRPLIAISRVEYYDGNGESDLILRCHPIVSIASLYNADANRTFDANSLITVADDVIIQKQTGIITLWNNEGTFLKGKANVKITYTAGWVVSSTVPHEVEAAIHRWIAKEYFSKYVNRRHDVSSQNQGNLTTSFLNEAIPLDVLSVIKAFKDRIGAPDFSYAD